MMNSTEVEAIAIAHTAHQIALGREVETSITYHPMGVDETGVVYDAHINMGIFVPRSIEHIVIKSSLTNGVADGSSSPTSESNENRS